MKIFLKFSLAVVIAFSSALSSCGKYEDGPKISLKTKMARITRVWTDASSTNANSTTEFKKDGSVYLNGAVASGWTWKFSSDKENIEWTYSSAFGSGTTSTKILRLTSKELWTQDAGSSTIDKSTAK